MALNDDDNKKLETNDDDAPFAREPEHPKVQLDKPKEESDDDDDEPRQTETPEQRATRQERRRERGRQREKETRERLEAAERRAQEAEQRAMHALQMAQRAHQPQQAPQDPHARIRERHAQIADDQARLQDQYNAISSKRQLSQEEFNEFRKKAIELDWEKTNLGGQAALLSQPQVNHQAEAQRAILRAEYGDVIANPRAVAYADAEWKRLMAPHVQGFDQYGRPVYDPRYDTKETVDKAMKHAREAAGLVSRPAPSQAERQRYSGVPKGGGAGGGTPETPASIEMTPAFRKMARAAFPDDDDKVAFQKWANGPGKRAMMAVKKSA